MNFSTLLKDKKERFKELCQSYSVLKLYAFGSLVTDRFNPETSDLDFMVEISEDDPLIRGEKLLDLWDKLEEFFGRKVDLLTESSLKNPVLISNILANRKLIYDGTSQKIFS